MSSRPLIAAPPPEPIDPVEAFTPFDAEETRVLRLFVQQVHELVETSFVKEGTTRLSLSFKAGEGGTVSLTHPGKEPLRSFLVPFRTLYMTKEPTEFGRVRNMLRAHALAKGTPDSNRATNVLDHLGKEWNRVVNKGTSTTLVEVELNDAGKEVSRNTLKPREVIDTWLGGTFHTGDRDKQLRLARWRPETFEFAVIQAVSALVDACAYLDSCIEAILGNPELVT